MDKDTTKSLTEGITNDEIDLFRNKIFALRDEIYTQLKNRWENSYGKDKFFSTINSLLDAANNISEIY